MQQLKLRHAHSFLEEVFVPDWTYCTLMFPTVLNQTKPFRNGNMIDTPVNVNSHQEKE
jgi:hypothetical protein